MDWRISGSFLGFCVRPFLAYTHECSGQIGIGHRISNIFLKSLETLFFKGKVLPVGG